MVINTFVPYLGNNMALIGANTYGKPVGQIALDRAQCDDRLRVVALLTPFMTSDLSAFYFDIRKDALYCEPPSSVKRKASLAVIEHIFRCVTTWLALSTNSVAGATGGSPPAVRSFSGPEHSCGPGHHFHSTPA